MQLDLPNNLSTPEARANRLREARKIAKLSLREMSNDDQINYYTLCGWESGKHGGLTERGAHKIIERLHVAGINCSIEWLLYGLGEKPTPIPPILFACQFTGMKEFIHKQMELFSQIYPNFISTLVEDDAMSPHYNKGDLVSGLPLANNKISEANGQDIIVMLTNNATIVRKLIIDKKNNSPMLLATNHNSSEPIIQNIEINQWALILCHFKYVSLYD